MMKYLRDGETYEDVLREVQEKLKSQEGILESCGNVSHWKVGLGTLGCIVEALQQAHERIQELEAMVHTDGGSSATRRIEDMPGLWVGTVDLGDRRKP